MKRLVVPILTRTVLWVCAGIVGSLMHVSYWALTAIGFVFIIGLPIVRSIDDVLDNPEREMPK